MEHILYNRVVVLTIWLWLENMVIVQEGKGRMDSVMRTCCPGRKMENLMSLVALVGSGYVKISKFVLCHSYLKLFKQ